ncbi:hypothetical protein E1A91_A07G054900v1 [Gossypium mustelinum]|uniref:Bidirectional sugar transporter SWEET n=1 Tax=Gossypium mustelinum TaxID=34275 RepID=A0A5D2YH73_GOSMU|nr:hypothetical protein E1A91_A07G054900v1 [Gossypium mustelinum]
MALHLSWVSVFGDLGVIISFMVAFSPLPAFYQIYKKKTSEGFQSLPYVTSLFSAMLWIYYALLKKNEMHLIIINIFCCFIQSFYIVTYFYYGRKKENLEAVKLMLLINVFGSGLIFFSTYFLHNPKTRLCILGYICLGFSASTYAAPLSIVRKVIKTKSVEFMPFTLSVFLTIQAVMWFFYGLLKKDINIAGPNILGFIFGILQMILYAIYKNHPKKMVVEDRKLQLSDQLESVVSSDVNTTAPQPKDKGYNNGGGGGGDVEAQNIKKNTLDASQKV